VVRREGGFSLLETMVALSIFSLAFAMIFPFLSLQKRMWGEQEIVRDEFYGLTAAMAWLTRDLQEAGYHGTGNPVRSVEESAITYELSRDEEDPDSFSPGNCRLVTVYLRGDDLMYRIQTRDPLSATWRRGSSHTLASGVTTFRLQGFDRSGEPAADPSQISAVEIVLSGRRSGELRTFVALRNLPAKGGPG
jgi:prepilin-type N-terminal cleavage/methylation domain-containing protein